MKISNDLRKEIVKEINYIVERMKKSANPGERLYYFSGVHAIANRVFNFEYDPDLVFLHLVLKQTYEAFIGRFNAIMKGGDSAAPLNEEQFKKLIDVTEELGEKIERKIDMHNTLKKFAVLSYSTTGNGHYLRQKGLLKL